MAHTRNSCIKIAQHRERRAQSHLSLRITWIYLDGLPKDFHASLGIYPRSESAHPA